MSNFNLHKRISHPITAAFRIRHSFDFTSYLVITSGSPTGCPSWFEVFQHPLNADTILLISSFLEALLRKIVPSAPISTILNAIKLNLFARDNGSVYIRYELDNLIKWNFLRV